jgi:hypothetical protein
MFTTLTRRREGRKEGNIPPYESCSNYSLIISMKDSEDKSCSRYRTPMHHAPNIV